MTRLAVLVFAAACLLPTLATSAPPAGRVLLLDDHGRQLSLLDAGSLAPLQRLAAPRPLRGPPKFSPDGRHAYVASTDGWITSFDLRELAAVAQVRAGEAVADFAVSGDGAWVLAGTASPPVVVLFDAQLREVRRYPAATLDGKLQSPVATVHDTGPRRSFVVGFETLPQLWEISYDPAAAPIFDGLVHDYRMGEAIASAGYLGVRRTPLEEPFAALAVAAQGRQVLGASPGDGGTGTALAVIHLDVRRRIARVPLAVTPTPARIAAFERQGCPLVALAGPEGVVQVVDASSWRVVRTLPTGGPARFAATHPNTPHVWVGSDEGKLMLVDKATLEAGPSLRVAGQLTGELAFTRDGRGLLVGVRSERERDALVAFDTATLAERQRLPTQAAPAPASWPLSSVPAPPCAAPATLPPAR